MLQGDIINMYYNSRLEELNRELVVIIKRASYLYLVRLMFFLLFIALFIIAFSSDRGQFFFVASAIFLGLFVWVALYDLRLRENKRDIERRIKFNEDELKTVSFNFDFRDGGDAFAHLDPHLSGDFDIFGAGSLYQYLNRSVTNRGKENFASCLVSCELRSDVIVSRSEAIKELSEKISFIENFAIVGSDVKESGVEVTNLLKWVALDGGPELFINVTRYLLPLLTLLIVILSVAGITSYSLLSMPFMASLIATYFNTNKFNRAHALLGRSTKALDRYSKLIRLIENEQFKSDILSKEKQKIVDGRHSASHSIILLKRLLSRFDYRFNIFVTVVLNGLLLFDFHTYMAILKWRKEHCQEIQRWFDAVAQIDSLIGLGVYGYNCSGTTSYAKVIDGDFKVEAHDLSHPLIAPNVRVANSLKMSNRPSVTIITGANMAGKSTFLRTLAVNLILGMNGAPVCANSFQFTPIKIVSSIKIQDSLKNRESYFYAELLRLSQILESINTQPQTMVILDEILRGTNTNDKQQGAIGLLRKLISMKSVAIIATHDLVIGKLEEEFPKYVSNYCFEVEIEEDKLSFDYKLKKGITTKLNASFLMHRMGIIDLNSVEV